VTRFNIALIAALAGSALSLITAQHEARLTHIALEIAQGEMRRLDADWTHLRVQQNSLSAPGLVDAKARSQLAMDAPVARHSLHAVRDPATGELRLRAVSLQGNAAVTAAARATPPNPQAAGVQAAGRVR
jgi:cell division protein FtsL